MDALISSLFCWTSIWTFSKYQFGFMLSLCLGLVMISFSLPLSLWLFPGSATSLNYSQKCNFFPLFCLFCKHAFPSTELSGLPPLQHSLRSSLLAVVTSCLTSMSVSTVRLFSLLFPILLPAAAEISSLPALGVGSLQTLIKLPLSFKKINSNTKHLNHTITHIDLIEICPKITLNKQRIHAFFSSLKKKLFIKNRWL